MYFRCFAFPGSKQSFISLLSLEKQLKVRGQAGQSVFCVVKLCVFPRSSTTASRPVVPPTFRGGTNGSSAGQVSILFYLSILYYLREFLDRLTERACKSNRGKIYSQVYNIPVRIVTTTTTNNDFVVPSTNSKVFFLFTCLSFVCVYSLQVCFSWGGGSG